jgi:hypothetical protein
MRNRIVGSSRIVLVVVIAVMLAAFLIAGSSYQESTNAQRSGAQIPFPGNNRIMESLTSLLGGDGIRVEGPLVTRSANSLLMQVAIESTDVSIGSNGFARALPSVTTFNVTGTRTDSGSINLRRTVELSRTQIFVAMLDGSGQLVWFDQPPDPRVVRAEFPDERGMLQGETIYRMSADMLVTVPTDRGVKSLRFYHPVWNGETFKLHLIGTLDIDPALTTE